MIISCRYPVSLRIRLIYGLYTGYLRLIYGLLMNLPGARSAPGMPLGGPGTPPGKKGGKFYVIFGHYVNPGMYAV